MSHVAQPNGTGGDNNADNVRSAGEAGDPTANTGALPKRELIPLFLGLMLAMLVSSLANTVLSSAMPTIVGELNGIEHMSWVVTATILASTVVMPIYGNLSDLFGRRPLMIVALTLFAIGSFLGGLADSMMMLVTARGIQGLGGGGLAILSQAAIADAVPARERGRYMGIMGGVFGLASVAGPILGGWFTDGPGWRWAFWFNLPLIGLALIAILVFMKLPKPPKPGRTDVLGMILLTIATTALVLLLTWGGTQIEWLSWQSAALIALTLVAAALFVAVEARAEEPIMPLAMFRERNFLLSTGAGLVVGIAMFGVLGYMPMYMQMMTGLGPTISGLLLTPMMVTLLITSVGAGRVVANTGRYKFMPLIGTAILGVSMWLLSTLTAESETWVICAYLALLGVGLGLSMQILVLIVQNAFPARIVGTATAANNYFRQVGATIGSTVVGSLFGQRLADRLTEIAAGAGAGSEESATAITPEMVTNLPEPLRGMVREAVNASLVPIFLDLVPLAIIAFVALLFVREDELSTEREVPVPSSD